MTALQPGPDSNTGILLIQMGTPDSPSEGDVRRYLREFLSDRRVVTMPRFLWLPILHGIILRTRPRKSARMYQKIWRSEGSPLLYYSRRQKELLAKALGETPVALGMRYGNPSLDSAIDSLISRGARRIIALPLYPHYAEATTGSALDALSACLSRRKNPPAVKIVDSFFAVPEYISALGSLIEEHISQNRPEQIILSYHGLPAENPDAASYCAMCEKTTMLLRQKLAHVPQPVHHAYQSRFGRAEWTKPYLLDTLVQSARSGIKHVAVAFPGFTADCLETLYEVGIEYESVFVTAGGAKLSLIPCLNDAPEWIDAMKTLVSL